MRCRLRLSLIPLAIAASLAALSTAGAEELRFRKDLNRDGKRETVVAKEIYDDSSPLRIPLDTKISIHRPDGSVAAVTLVPNGNPEISFVSLNADGRQQIVVSTAGGIHYTGLHIFDYRDGALVELFSNGSACEVKADFKTRPPTIHVGRADWDDPQWSYASKTPLWNVYAWDGKAFVFDAAKSTAREIKEEEELSRFVDKVTEGR